MSVACLYLSSLALLLCTAHLRHNIVMTLAIKVERSLRVKDCLPYNNYPKGNSQLLANHNVPCHIGASYTNNLHLAQCLAMTYHRHFFRAIFRSFQTRKNRPNRLVCKENSASRQSIYSFSLVKGLTKYFSMTKVHASYSFTSITLCVCFLGTCTHG